MNKDSLSDAASSPVLGTPAPQVSNLLDRLFAKFDALCTAHGLFKVETIGDCYIAAAGACVRVCACGCSQRPRTGWRTRASIPSS